MLIRRRLVCVFVDCTPGTQVYSQRGIFATDCFHSAIDTHTEVLFSAFVAKHNISFAVPDHFTDLCQHMFPDSEIAKKFACRRTKTTHIVNWAITPSFDSKVTEACENEKFSIMVDESNDQGGEKTGYPDQSGTQIRY